MKNVPHLPPLAIIAIALLVPACRSTRNITSTQSSTTTITQKEMDIATRHAVTTRKRKLTITYFFPLPSFQIVREHVDMLLEFRADPDNTEVILKDMFEHLFDESLKASNREIRHNHHAKLPIS